jgi:hypothetical protein
VPSREEDWYPPANAAAPVRVGSQDRAGGAARVFSAGRVNRHARARSRDAQAPPAVRHPGRRPFQRDLRAHHFLGAGAREPRPTPASGPARSVTRQSFEIEIDRGWVRLTPIGLGAIVGVRREPSSTLPPSGPPAPSRSGGWPPRDLAVRSISGRRHPARRMHIIDGDPHGRDRAAH